jgi:hypothetical protein
MDVERYTATLSPRQRRIFLALDQYADAATGVLALVSVALQLLIGTPGAVVLAVSVWERRKRRPVDPAPVP